MKDPRQAFIDRLRRVLAREDPAAICIVIAPEDALALGQDLEATRRPEDRPWGYVPGVSAVPPAEEEGR